MKQLATCRRAEHRFGVLEGKIDGVAGTLVGVQRDVRRRSDNVATLGTAIDDPARSADFFSPSLFGSFGSLDYRLGRIRNRSLTGEVFGDRGRGAAL